MGIPLEDVLLVEEPEADSSELIPLPFDSRLMLPYWSPLSPP